MGKKIFRSNVVQSILAMVLAGYMKLVKHSTKWSVQGQEIVEPIWLDGKGVIVALWHSRVLMTFAGWPMKTPPKKQQPGFLISLSPDGAFIAKATALLGASVIRGSSVNPKKTSKYKGGPGAFRKMFQFVEQGGCLAITPDGPRGPKMRAHLGAVKLAAMTGAPILCFGYSSSRARFFKTWDRFCLPLPFAKAVIVWEGPIFVPKTATEAELENKRLQMEQLINIATRRADLACGQVPIEPVEKTKRTEKS